MNTSSGPEAAQESGANQSDGAVSCAEAERIAERVQFLFRQAGDSPPTRELKGFLMAYRLGVYPDE